MTKTAETLLAPEVNIRRPRFFELCPEYLTDERDKYREK